ncbi:MAG: transposase, partial [Campylobacterales bacterium]|nr:transposase [Campylobacterales bacterium]
MARRPRLDMAGYHHVINRGVARSNIFTSSTDKDKFLQILCKACKLYDVIVHDYCLMDNHYHLFLETKQENLSLIMRQLNSYYAIYFNKKENRVGYLWQGRFRSWYVVNEEYLYLLLRYIESNPLKANLSNKIGEYPYTLSSALFGNSEIISCAKGSILIHDFSPQTLIEFLETELSEEELAALNEEQKRKVSIENEEVKVARSKILPEHFHAVTSKQERNSAIISAFKDGH